MDHLCKMRSFLLDKALKAMQALFQILKEVETPVNIMLLLFDSLVVSILNYGCESWGFLNAKCIERIHRKFLKHIFHVKISTNNYAVIKSSEGIHLLSKDKFEL